MEIKSLFNNLLEKQKKHNDKCKANIEKIKRNMDNIKNDFLYILILN